MQKIYTFHDYFEWIGIGATVLATVAFFVILLAL